MEFRFPEEAGSFDKEYKGEYHGRFVATGTFFCHGVHGGTVPKIYRVEVPPEKHNGIYLLQVSLSMLTAPGGPFDNADTVFADISDIDTHAGSVPHPTWTWTKEVLPNQYQIFHAKAGGVGIWGHHFGRPAFVPSVDTPSRLQAREGFQAVGYDYPFFSNPSNMRPSSMIAQVAHSVAFRLSITGDDWAAATWLVLEL